MSEQARIRLLALAVANYRCFTSLRWEDIHPTINVITAPNGGGKTAVLDAIAVALAPFPQTRAATQGGNINDTDVARRILQERTVRANSDVTITMSACLGASDATWSIERGPSESKRTRTKRAEPIKTYAQTSWAARVERGAPLPVIARYGTSRLWGEQRHTTARRAMEVEDGYRDCLDPRVDFQAFQEWVSSISHDRQNPESGEVARQDWDFLLDVLNSILEPAGLTRFEYSAAQQALLAGSETSPLLPVRDHSDGIRTILGMVGDLARRICLLNSGIDGFDLRDTPGVVMVDEVDLHLHPLWQQQVADALTKAFPRVQWILTTHSPQVVSTVARESVWILRTTRGQSEIVRPDTQTEGEESSSVLASIFDVDPMPATRWAEKLNLLDASVESRDPEVSILLEEVSSHFGANHPHVQNWRLRRKLLGVSE